ncbi:MAG: response regulator transcription factor [Lachnospiraceae bacterium]|jgi:two-component system response regulator VanR|nr:response regulator transcription factor [Lachnospiraceae bacterium]
MKKILITEDEPEIREVLYNYLTNEGFEVDMASDGVQALAMFAENAYDLVLLDIMIPKIDGYNVCEVIKKQSDVPVVFLSALSDDKSQIKGYDLMADDYVTKPFSIPVLVRKINALLRRNERTTAKEGIIIYGDLMIDPAMMEARVNGKAVELTSKEFDILATLAKNPGRIYTREILLDLLWDYNSLVDERIVDTHIKNLRHKLGGGYIETVRGRGYRIAKKDV